MKIPRLIPSLTGALVVLACLSAPASAAVTLVNGDFENTAGLGGGLPWYSGVPAGWNGANHNYTVGTDGASTVGNLEQLADVTGGFNPLYQDLGTLDTLSTVTLTFVILQPWNGNPIEIGAAIWPNTTYASDLGNLPQITTPGTYSITAANVPAGTALRIGFWRNQGSPGIDHVSFVATPVPEPSWTALALAGGLGLLRRRRSSGGR
jgi:MYXO-CTERM domain-containing protein